MRVVLSTEKVSNCSSATARSPCSRQSPQLRCRALSAQMQCADMGQRSKSASPRNTGSVTWTSSPRALPLAWPFSPASFWCGRQEMDERLQHATNNKHQANWLPLHSNAPFGHAQTTQHLNRRGSKASALKPSNANRRQLTRPWKNMEYLALPLAWPFSPASFWCGRQEMDERLQHATNNKHRANWLPLHSNAPFGHAQTTQSLL